jgi:hypothetical protein
LTQKERAEQWRAKQVKQRALFSPYKTKLSSQEASRSTSWVQIRVIIDKCRLCKRATESIQHICSGCPALAQKDYLESLERHNLVAKVVSQALAKRYELTETELTYYKCKPEQVLSNDKAKFLWDTAIITDRSVEVNRPDLVLFDKMAETIIVDIAKPLDDNL